MQCERFLLWVGLLWAARNQCGRLTWCPGDLTVTAWDFPAIISPESRMAACFIDFLILVSENLTGFPGKIVAFDLEGLILMKCHFTLTTFMEKALFLKKIIFHYHDELTSGSYFN